MLYSVSGKLALKAEHFAVVTAGGLGIKLFASRETLKALPAVSASVTLFTHLYVREDALDLYGFSTPEELDIAPLGELSAAIKEGRPDLLTRASGVGRKTAERVIVELRSKVQSARSGLVIEKMQTDADLVEALTSLGYRREEARAALAKVDPKVHGVEERLKAALAILSKK